MNKFQVYQLTAIPDDDEINWVVKSKKRVGIVELPDDAKEAFFKVLELFPSLYSNFCYTMMGINYHTDKRYEINHMLTNKPLFLLKKIVSNKSSKNRLSY